MLEMRRWLSGAVVLGACLLLTDSFAEDPKNDLSNAGPLTPQEERATFRVPKGFRVELVASEPAIIDPVAMAFDEEGRLFVAEMRGYPNAGVATGSITSGRVKLLEDRDGDGFYEHWTTYAEGLRFPTSVMPWKGGLLVAVAPDILFFEDKDGDGKAEQHRSLYTGFDLSNIQQLVNSLQWGLDNWVYGCVGSKGGTVHSVEKPDQPAVELRGRHIRFHPDQPGSLEPTSGGGQFGLAPDDWQQWFTATNSQHLRHIILPDHYLRRNPSLPVSAVTLDIPDHDAACKVYRISPFEAWRVERTRRRSQGPEARRFPSTELVPGGYITSACSPVVYTAALFPQAYRGNTFVCDPANNLIHRDVLVPHGATFVAQRADADREFMASTDNWFRPVNLTIGPDGALYVADFYREVIETPLSLPDDIKARLNLESRSRGRIWRVVPEGWRPGKKPSLRKASAEDLVLHLDDANSWWRLTAQRLLMERQDRTAIQALERLARQATTPQGRAHALWVLHGLNTLDEGLIQRALHDTAADVREQALRLAEEYLASSASLRAEAVSLADDSSPRVRFQLAFSLGAADSPEVIQALARVVQQDVHDPWTQVAVLSSVSRTAPALLESLSHQKRFTETPTPAHRQFWTRLAALVGARGQDAELGQALNLLTQTPRDATWKVALLDGLGQGLQNSRRPLSRLWEQPPEATKQAVQEALTFFRKAAGTIHDAKNPVSERAAATRLLSYAPFGIAGPALQDLLTPQNPGELQLAAVRSLAMQENSKVPELLLSSWGSYSPEVRREVLESLLARPGRVSALLDALEHKTILAGQLEPARIEQLKKYRDPRMRARAQQLLGSLATSDRQKIVEAYRSALELPTDAARGKAVFKMICATCHRLEEIGTEVGPDLLSALRNKTKEMLLIDILDPSREVDPRYINYVIATKEGRVLTGMIAAETGSSITLRRAEKAEDTLLRNQIEEIQATAKSVMPEGLETQLSKQNLADVIAYLQSVASPK